MYHDIFARISVPHIYGTIAIQPVKHVDLTSAQIRVMQAEPDQISTFYDQFGDVADVQYGANELNAPFAQVELVTRYIALARTHLHAGAAIVTGGYDHRGAVQSGLLAGELALKAAAAANGDDEHKIKERYGHKLDLLIDRAAALSAKFDAGRVRRAVESQPRYVANRYASEQPNRLEVGHTIMRAQYIVSEVVRLLSSRDFRQGAAYPWPRCYPP